MVRDRTMNVLTLWKNVHIRNARPHTMDRATA